FSVVVVFWAIFHQNGTALTDWAVENTDRRPAGPVKFVTEKFSEFAEDAPLSYYDNAGSDTPRPSRDQLQIVSDETYEALKKEKKLAPGTVTQKQFDAIYARADDTTPMLGREQKLHLVNAELFQSINPGLVIIFTPLLIAFWRSLAQRGMEPSTPGKIGIGLLLTAGGPVIMLLASMATGDGTPNEVKASPWWLFGAYCMLTVGELCLSPMGLSLVSKMAPARMRSLMMGGWFLSTAVGNKLSGIFGELYTEWDHKRFYALLIVCVLAAAGAIFAMLPWLKSELPAEDSGHQDEQQRAAG
ncbi:MAG: peptide MFS transporter, partial [Armatimonadetes bacterium]|nr:peptide MFS transporter [Armatimonadota bacterium]